MPRARHPARIALAGATVGALAAGLVTAAPTGAGAATAQRRQPALEHVGGVVTTWPEAARHGTSFSILGRHRHAVSVTVANGARYSEAGVAHPDRTYLFPGVKVVLIGHASKAGSAFLANEVRIAPDPAREMPGIVVKRPSTPGPNGVATFAIRNGHHVFTVDVFRNTAYAERAVHRPGLRDVSLGERVVVLGEKAWPRTTIYAQRVTVRNPKLFA